MTINNCDKQQPIGKTESQKQRLYTDLKLVNEMPETSDYYLICNFTQSIPPKFTNYRSI